MSILNRLNTLEKKRSTLLAELLNIRAMVRGSFSVSFGRCGTATCWCATADKGHPHNRIAWGKDAKKFTKTIPADEIPWIKEMTKGYKQFRAIRRRLRTITDKQRLLLDQLEDELVEKTKGNKNYH